ncbi:MAG TPA: helix-turn-helix transcriptional regulator [Gaiellaceae bacterium]|nr:helix-turn-helix transcriptional regulator [Gaiellaceae bacterium]
MAQLARVEARRLLAFLGDAKSLDGPDPFTPELLDRLGSTLASEFATFYTFDGFDRSQRDYVACSLEARYAVPLDEEWHRAPRYARVGPDDVRLWSDMLDRPARDRYESAPFAELFEVVDCAWTVIETGGHEGAMVCLHRQERDFTERDRRSLAVLRPHVAGLIRNARTRRRLADLMAAVDMAGTGEPQGFVLLADNREIEHASPSARLLIRRWFDERTLRLPEPVHDWLGCEWARPLVVERDGRRLVIEAPTRRALVLTDEPAPAACLTAREHEVLGRVAEGRSTAEIARMLFVTPATVSKHLENIYGKLGVHNRAAALAASGALRRRNAAVAENPVRDQ